MVVDVVVVVVVVADVVVAVVVVVGVVDPEGHQCSDRLEVGLISQRC